jgi:hypothetical protein
VWTELICRRIGSFGDGGGAVFSTRDIVVQLVKQIFWLAEDESVSKEGL